MATTSSVQAITALINSSVSDQQHITLCLPSLSFSPCHFFPSHPQSFTGLGNCRCYPVLPSISLPSRPLSRRVFQDGGPSVAPPLLFSPCHFFPSYPQSFTGLGNCRCYPVLPSISLPSRPLSRRVFQDGGPSAAQLFPPALCLASSRPTRPLSRRVSFRNRGASAAPPFPPLPRYARSLPSGPLSRRVFRDGGLVLR